jgi:GNAT superfamily N-acetyltransferase
MIRPASAADAAAIAAVRAVTWRKAYAGLIAPDILARVTAPDAAPFDPPPYRRTLVAVGGPGEAVTGFASYGPERSVLPPAAPPSPADGRAGPPRVFPSELSADGQAGRAGELYALYVTPAAWSTGAGRALSETVTAALRDAGYRRMVLWVLAGNARARRFYAKAGFAPDGAVNVLAGLGGVEEVRYARDL